MSIWAEAEFIVPQPKKVNVKDVVLRVLKEKYNNLDETCVDSMYSKENGVKLNLSTTHVGSFFNKLTETIISELKKEDIGYFYVDIKRNCYL